MNSYYCIACKTKGRRWTFYLGYWLCPACVGMVNRDYNRECRAMSVELSSSDVEKIWWEEAKYALFLERAIHEAEKSSAMKD